MFTYTEASTSQEAGLCNQYSATAPLGRSELLLAVWEALVVLMTRLWECHCRQHCDEQVAAVLSRRAHRSV